MKLSKKYVNAKAVCDLLSAFGRHTGVKECDKLVDSVISGLKHLPGIKAPRQNDVQLQDQTFGAISDFVSALDGDTYVEAFTKDGKCIYKGSVGVIEDNYNGEYDNLIEQYEDYVICGIKFVSETEVRVTICEA